MIASLLSQLQKAKNGLEDAQIAYCGVSASCVEAKRALELAEATSTLGASKATTRRSGPQS